MAILTLSNVYDKRNNSFNDLRFFFAALVLYVHSYVLLYGQSDRGTDPITILTHFQLSPGTLAVYGFFVLSGFFMIQSLESNRSLWQYTKHRILRIIPAFWLSLLLTCFILIPLISSTSIILSAEPGSALYFFIHSAIFQVQGAVWTITGAFPANPLIDNINGSMWTLKYEALLYMVLPIAFWLAFYQRRWIFIGTLGLLILSIAYILNEFVLFSINSDHYGKLVILTMYFFSGVLLYLYRERVIVSKWYLIFFSILFLSSMFLGYLKIVALFLLPYLVVSIGALGRTKWFSKSGDYSYGMYIYAFPIQQTLVHFYHNELNVYGLFIISFGITLILSVLSWHWLEKRILSYK